MSTLDAWRGEARRLIPKGFLRRDRGAFLFVSDFPRQEEAVRTREGLLAAGFTVRTEGGLAHIGVTQEKLRELMAAVPAAAGPADGSLYLWALARRLAGGSEEMQDQPPDVIYETLKYLDAGDFAGLDRYLRPWAAERQRRGLPLPALAGRLILQALEMEKGAEESC